jgi:FKBP-type peptidyl-prolyl cis-trans isomerase SlpA
VELGDIVTFHFKLARGDGKVIDDSFAGGEAHTATLGSGDLEPRLERCLVGLQPGQREVFLLDPGMAFGERDESLVQSLSKEDIGDGISFEPGTWREFSLPNGQRLAGLVLETDSDRVKVDFNHPLAGWPITLEIEVIAIET